MSTTLTNGIIIPENGSRNWGGDLANNWNILDVNVGYMNDVKNRVTTLENSVVENTSNIQTNASNISALQTSKQDTIEDLETIRTGATAGATAVQPSELNNYLPLTGGAIIGNIENHSNSDGWKAGFEWLYNNERFAYIHPFTSEASGEKSLFIQADTFINLISPILKFNNKNIDMIKDQGADFLRFSDGFQICWGNFKGITTSQKTISFSKAFSDSASISVNGQSGIYVTVDSWTNSTFDVISTTSSNPDAWFLWLAVGRWK